MDKNFPRLLATLAVLQRAQQLTTPQVRARLEANGYPVTARTVQRDLEELAAVYPLECDRRSRPFAWRWRGDAVRVTLPAMDWPEAISFHLLSTYLEGLLPPSVRDGIASYVGEARRRLAEHFDDLPLRRWPERIRVLPGGLTFEAPKVPRTVQAAVSEAVLLGRQLRIRYKAFDRATASEYVVSPLGLVQHGVVFYVPVRFDGHEDVRTLTLHRVQRAELLAHPSGIESFDLSAWIDGGAMGFGHSVEVRLVMLLREGAAGLLREAPLSHDQQITVVDASTDQVVASVRDTPGLRRWLLGLGARATVLEPVDLRQALSQEHAAAAANYANE